jgi:hypothetical protein
MSMCAVTLDCDDAMALAEFYHRATGLAWHPKSSDGFAGLVGEDGFFLGFQPVAGYRAPRWPGQDVPQQMHLDFRVDDLDEAEARLVALGATRARPQPDPERFRVLLDPAGHPFCLVY